MTRSDRRFDLKRARSAPMAVLLSRNAAAISGVVRPPNVRKVKATRDLGSNAGWQQVKIRRRRLTAILSDSVSSDLASKAISAARRASRAPVRSRSMALRSATFSNQPRGLSGKPALPQCLRQGSSGSAQSRSTLQSSRADGCAAAARGCRHPRWIMSWLRAGLGCGSTRSGKSKPIAGRKRRYGKTNSTCIFTFYVSIAQGRCRFADVDN